MQTFFLTVKRLWILAGVILLLLLVLDAVLEWAPPLSRKLTGKPIDLRLKTEHPAWDAADWKRFWSEPFVWEPYSYWRLAPIRSHSFTVDEQGLRKTVHPFVSNRKTIRVWVFGGSEVWGIGVRDAGTLPSFLSGWLAEKTGANLEVTNFGQPGYQSTQEWISLLSELNKSQAPDLVIFLDGVDDIYAAAGARSAGITPLESARSNTRLDLAYGARKNFLRQIWANLALMRDMTFYKTLTPFRYASKGLADLPTPEKEKLDRDIVTVYAANLKQIQGLARIKNFKTLFYWQPMLLSKRHRPLEEETWNALLPDSDFYAAVNAGIETSTALSQKKNFHPLNHFFDQENGTIFLDYADLTEDGNRRLAAHIAEDAVTALRSSPQLP